VGTAYPHPNQFHHNRVQKGDSLQVAGVVKIGGCGGELYCPYQVAPWKPVEKTWEVMAQARGCRSAFEGGTRCQEVARPIHEMQLQNGCRSFYQRIGHGKAWRPSGPYISSATRPFSRKG
jgi:hypothetical protein